MDKTLLTSRTRYIVPFMFEPREGFEEVIDNISAMGNWIVSDNKTENFEHDTYRLIRDGFIMQDNNSNIGCSLEYLTGDDYPIKKINYTRFENKFIVDISQMGMFLFRTGVGFLWYEADFPEETSVDKAVLFENEFKELSYERFVNQKYNNHVIFEDLTSPQKEGILMGHWINEEILNKLPIKVTYFAERRDYYNKNILIPDKALIFNYIVHKKGEEGENELLYQLTNGYNSKYKCKADIKKEFYEPFSNASCYVTQGGCGYLAAPELDNQNFYLRTFKKKIMVDYFTLYILALYQFYTILRFTKTMQSVLSAEVNDYHRESQKNLDILQSIETEINIFLIKSIYSSVSYIDHQNRFYQYVIERLSIKDNMESLTVGLESLRKLQEAQEIDRITKIEKLENEEREMFDDRFTIGLGLLSILALISAVGDGMAVADALSGIFNLSEDPKHIIEILFFILIIFVAVIAIGTMIPSIKRYRKKRKALKYKENIKNI